MEQQNPFDNQRFRKEFEETLDSKLGPLSDLVAAHETYIQSSKGFGRAVMIGWTGLIAAAEWFFHSRK